MDATNITEIYYPYQQAEVGKNDVIEINEFLPEMEGDKMFYDIVYKDGKVERVFNPTKVVFIKDQE